MRKKFLASHTQKGSERRAQKWRFADFLVSATNRIKKIRTLIDAVSTNELVRCKLQLRLRNHANMDSYTCAGCEGALQLACMIYVYCHIGVACIHTYHTNSDGERKPAAKTLCGWQERDSARLLLAGFSSFVCREGRETCSFRNIGKYSVHCPLRLRYDNNNERFPVYSPSTPCDDP